MQTTPGSLGRLFHPDRKRSQNKVFTLVRPTAVCIAVSTLLGVA
jgi:hypothetical protein